MRSGFLLAALLLPLCLAAPAPFEGKHKHDGNDTRNEKIFENSQIDMGDLTVDTATGDNMQIGHTLDINVVQSPGVQSKENADDSPGLAPPPVHSQDGDFDERLRRLFKSMDGDKDGIISVAELIHICHENDIYITEPEAERVITLPDETVPFTLSYFIAILENAANSSDTGDLIQFLLHSVGSLDHVMFDKNLMHVFLALDVDHDCQLFVPDILSVFQDLGNHQGRAQRPKKLLDEAKDLLSGHHGHNHHDGVDFSLWKKLILGEVFKKDDMTLIDDWRDAFVEVKKRFNTGSGEVEVGSGVVEDCQEGTGPNSYSGSVSTTTSGRTCQNWKIAAGGYYEDYESLGDHNYCRNLDGDENGVWCCLDNYCEEDSDWGYCDVPQCKGEGKPSCKGRNFPDGQECCESDDPEGSKCVEGQGDCDSDEGCAGNLVCGTDNCMNYNPLADPEDDCCTPKFVGDVMRTNIENAAKTAVNVLKHGSELGECYKGELIKVESASIDVKEGLQYKLQLRVSTMGGDDCMESREMICENIMMTKPLPKDCKGTDSLKLINREHITCELVEVEKIGFEACVDEWCLQDDTDEQYTRCEEATDGGNTCINPLIKYGSTEGSVPTQESVQVLTAWCKMIFHEERTGTAIYGERDDCTAPKGYVYWCAEDGNPWCDADIGPSDVCEVSVLSLSCAPGDIRR